MMFIVALTLLAKCISDRPVVDSVDTHTMESQDEDSNVAEPSGTDVQNSLQPPAGETEESDISDTDEGAIDDSEPADSGPLGAGCTATNSQSYAQYTTQQVYTTAMMEKDWPGASGAKGLDGRTKVEDGAIIGFFPKDTILGQETGFTWMSKFDTPSEDHTIEYTIKFSPGFDWTKGGKIPGFCGGTCPRGCSHPTGGFSARIMWRKDGGIETYPYLPSSTTRCGESWPWDVTLQSGEWYHIKMRVKLNTIGKKDGENQAWVNGKMVFHKTEIEYRAPSDANVKIDTAYITTYVGGSSMDFAPKQDQTIAFKEFKTYSGTCSNNQ